MKSLYNFMQLSFPYFFFYFVIKLISANIILIRTPQEWCEKKLLKNITQAVNLSGIYTYLSFRQIELKSKLSFTFDRDVMAEMKFFLKLQSLIVSVNHTILVFRASFSWKKRRRRDNDRRYYAVNIYRTDSLVNNTLKR